ncbi:MAG: amidohydrolase [Longimicrobiales bacterium]
MLLNGRIVTVDPERPEAEALAVADDRIMAVGSRAEIEPHIGSETRVIDLRGRLTIPGFIEGHGHFMGLGEAKLNLDLTRAANWQDIVDLVAAAAREAQPGEWIIGRGWHQEKWSSMPEPTVDGVPTHHTLSAVSPQNPVLLTHASGHASLANATALELAGVTRATPDPDGGTIVRDAEGNATGLLRETASGVVGRARSQDLARRSPEEVEQRARRVIELAGQEALSKGVTSFHDAGVSFTTVDLYERLAEEGALPVRLYVMIREGSDEMARNLAAYRTVGAGNEFLTVRAIKKSIDGALGSHGAWLLEPYTDMPSTAGLNTTPLDEMERTARLAIEHDYQLNVHAIGDRANREVLDLYERTFDANPEKRDLRWRIEHAQHLHPTDIPRFGELGVIAAMQGVHATSDAPWVPRRLGEQRAREGAYVWESLRRAGARIANGTDVPVEDIDPIASYYASISRRTSDGSVFYSEQRMSRQYALESYTINNAYAAFEEDLKGSLSVGKLADIVVLSADILTVPEEEVPNARVVYTILGGQVVYTNEALAGAFHRGARQDR